MNTNLSFTQKYIKPDIIASLAGIFSFLMPFYGMSVNKIMKTVEYAKYFLKTDTTIVPVNALFEGNSSILDPMHLVLFYFVLVFTISIGYLGIRINKWVFILFKISGGIAIINYISNIECLLFGGTLALISVLVLVLTAYQPAEKVMGITAIPSLGVEPQKDEVVS